MPNSPSELSRKSWVQPYNNNYSVPTMNEFHAGDEQQRLGDSYNANYSQSPSAAAAAATSSNQNNTSRVPPSSTTVAGNDDGTKSRGFFGWSKKQQKQQQQLPSEKPSFNESAGASPALDEKPKHETVEEIAITKTRRVWEAITWFFTWWIPTPLLSSLGRMKRPDVRMAWREKVAICIIIVFIWAILLFIIVGLGLVLCPRQHAWGIGELGDHNSEKDAYIALNGTVYDITDFIKTNHGRDVTITNWLTMGSMTGKNVNNSFQISLGDACPGTGNDDDQGFLTTLRRDPDDTDPDINTDHVYRPNVSNDLGNKHFYTRVAIPALKSYRKGDLVWERKLIEYMHKDVGKAYRIIGKNVYNFNDYVYTMSLDALSQNDRYKILPDIALKMLQNVGGFYTDITEYWNPTHLNVSRRQFNVINNCINNLFYLGKVDERRSVRCLFSNYMLLAFACVLMLVVLSKFIAALQFGTKKRPLPPQKHVLCQVPCYTENDESLEVTLSSLAALDYNDKCKLIFVICDGNIIGSGNDRPTPRIVLDILGVDPEYDPPARDYLAIAEGSRRHNRAKVYSGLYEFEGHVVPFLVVAKVGTPEEMSRAGNRGKRDSQIILMQFLNKVHFDLPMTPLELEIYHQMRHIIGIPPQMFEFILQIDADTRVVEDSLSRLVAACTDDSRIAGICGETMLGNENRSWTTMIQVYEYFISHHMAKAFESLFGSVTCLPGCFCMYRIRNKQGKPLVIASPVVEAYSELHVDTLHKKNLLSLGEDRYLTTLMMKYFPTSKLKFIRDAKAYTIAPEKWSVLLSQRRRWINSTIHNLVELMSLPDMCGFCCFSMRFVVFLDLFGTITMPATLIYFVILIYIAVSDVADVGYISLILIGAIYGVQAVIFLLRREWQHIGWMIIYLIAFPLWSFILPIYSFWHFDDFSWGNTRVVVGEGKRKVVISDDKEFDPDSIPQRRWHEYEQELAMLGLLNAPPPNMNASVHDEDRMTTASRMSHVQSTVPPGGIAYPQSVYIPADPRLSMAATPQPMLPYDPRMSRVASPAQMMPMPNMAGSMPVAAAQIPQAYSPHNTQQMLNPADTTSIYSNQGVMPLNADQYSNLQGGGTPGMMQSGLMPNDEQLTEAIRHILSTSDLQTITKKRVREQLSLQFGIDLTPRKEFISDAIELILNGQL